VRRAETFGPLVERPFRRLWLAATTSAVGDAFVPVALAFAVLGIGGTAISLGLVLAAGTIAGLVSYLAGGVWADRLSRRNLMLTADLVRLAVEAAVAVLLLTRHAHIWELGAAYAVTSVSSSVFQPASRALLAEIVAPTRLQKANSLLSISTSAAMVAGPALSGLMVAAAGVCDTSVGLPRLGWL
jgi:MFS family permease